MVSSLSHARGFAGLSHALSDKAEELRIVNRSIPALSSPALPSTASTRPLPKEPIPVQSGGSSRSARLWLFLLCVAGIGVVIAANQPSQRPSPSYTPSYQQPTRPAAPAVPAYQPQQQPTWTPSVSVVQPAQERKPGIGTDLVLGDDEIRYCLSQKVRIEAAEAVLNQTSSYQINTFNMLVNDYNSRCSSYRYKASAMGRVRPEVERRTDSLRAEGRRLVQ